AEWMGPPTWSRDGATLRYVQREGTGFSIFAVPWLGGPARRTGAVSLNVNIATPSLSPDGTRLVQALPSPAGLQITNLASGDSALIPLAAPYTWIGELAWSAQGDRLAVVTAGSDRNGWILLVLSPDDGGQFVLARDRWELGGAVFAPDGRALFYLRSAGRLKTLIRQRLDRRGAPVGPAAVVGTDLDFGPSTPDDVDPPRLSISDDGRHIAYVRRELESNLRLLPLDHRGAERELTTGSGVNQHARFSPDDSAVAYVRSESRGVSLMRLRLDSGSSTVVTAAEELPDVAWSPDGRSIAALSQVGESGMGVTVVRLGTGAGRRFGVGEVGSELTWVDPGRLVLQRPGNRSFALASVETGRVVELDRLREQGFLFSPRVSPDGRWLAFCLNGHERIAGLYLASLADTTVRLVDAAHDLEPLRWSPDGRIVYAAHRGLIREVPEVYAYLVAGGPGKLLDRLPLGPVIEDITRDGRRLLVRDEDRRSDVWLLEESPSSR
ncbi:MAG TPA: hypothetical protein VNH46_09435, partial [Gemmatimonadales bacterium]|nr:hypothetical protein [Gemmatimonadales bacterium]